jgi:hypothetical protein
MGKRELLIAVCFIAIGFIAYQLTAPPPKDGERGFSLSRIFSQIRSEMRSNSTRVQHKHEGTLPMSAELDELRLNPGRSSATIVTAEDRKDIAYELQVESTGPDEATALKYAKETALKTDDMGSALAISVFYPAGGRQTSTLTLRVPAALAVRLESGSRSRVKGVRAVMLGAVSGETLLNEVKGAVTGTHRQGDLTVTRAGSVNLTLVSSRAKFSEIDRALTLNARAGESEVSQSRGTVEITATNSETTVTGHDGPVQISGEGGVFRLKSPKKESRVDVRRAEVIIELQLPVSVTAFTTDETLRLELDGAVPIDLDASVSSGGSVQASDFSLHADKSGDASRLHHVFGDKGARVVLRNTRADIVIGKRK